MRPPPAERDAALLFALQFQRGDSQMGAAPLPIERKCRM
jgi:hypothetical protein